MSDSGHERAATRHPGDLARGGSQSGVRLYNERLVLSLIRRYGSLPKAEIARVTGLSAQTASVIVKQLEADGLLLRQTPQRGKIGQPPVPLSLNPDGAFSVGLKVGRRSADLVLVDLTGRVRAALHQTYRYPEPPRILAFVREGVKQPHDEECRRQSNSSKKTSQLTINEGSRSGCRPGQKNSMTMPKITRITGHTFKEPDEARMASTTSEYSAC